MRIIPFVVAAVLLAGCDTGDGWVPGRDVVDEPAAAPATEQQTTASPVSATIDAHCQAVAKQRASDARANGYSLDMEDTIYQGTYRDCVAWDSQHGR